MDRHEYMTTGEFASAMGVSKDTLFHYDDIGLFCPEKVSENGYRYYSIYQMETFDTIRMLRDLGMPLKEIRDMLAHRSPERVMHVFAEREQQIDRQIEKLKADMARCSWLRKPFDLTNCRCRKNRFFGSDDSGIFREILFVWACSGWPGEIHLSENQRVDCGIQEVGYAERL